MFIEIKCIVSSNKLDIVSELFRVIVIFKRQKKNTTVFLKNVLSFLKTRNNI